VATSSIRLLCAHLRMLGVQFAERLSWIEWMGHSAAALLSHYAHDVAGKSVTLARAIRSARRGRPIDASSSTASNGRRVVAR
jgi:hypothetical protein